MTVDRFIVQPENIETIEGTVIRFGKDEWFLVEKTELSTSTDGDNDPQIQQFVFVDTRFEGDMTLTLEELESLSDSNIIRNFKN